MSVPWNWNSLTVTRRLHLELSVWIIQGQLECLRLRRRHILVGVMSDILTTARDERDLIVQIEQSYELLEIAIPQSRRLATQIQEKETELENAVDELLEFDRALPPPI